MKKVLAIATVLFFTACVTINVYFPEAEAKEAASESVERIMGLQKDKEGDNQSSIDVSRTLYMASKSIVDFVIPSAYAGQSAAVKKVEASLQSRFGELGQFFDKGVIGLTNDGFVTVKDLGAASPKDRGKVKKLVSSENKDRKTLYKELARADGKPEWEKKHQEIYAKTWIEKAKKGWWYQNGSGKWIQK